MKKHLLLILLTTSFIVNVAFSQEKNKIKKGTIYLSWGYNRESYTNSNLHFKNTTSDNYDFELINAAAHDKSEFNDGLSNFLSKDLTIPQYNFHIGYLFNNKRKLGIELSWDHLKYVLNDNASIHLKGQIRGREIDKDTFVTPDFIHLQHTNGNNYLMLNIVKTYPLYLKKNIQVEMLGKLGAGPLVSYTISTIMGSYNPGKFRIHGYVIGTSLATRVNFLKYFFIQPSFQYAFANYLSTEIGSDNIGKVTHYFSSYTFMLEAGFKINIKK